MDGKINEQEESKTSGVPDTTSTIETDSIKIIGQNYDGKAKFLEKQLFVKWFEEGEFDRRDDDDLSSLGDSASCTYTSSLAESDEQSLGDTLDSIQITDRLRSNKTTVINNDQSSPVINHIDVLQNIMTGENSIQSFGNIKIERSKHVHIGNVVHINGPINIINTGGGNIETVNQSTGQQSKPSAEKIESNSAELFIDTRNCTGKVSNVLRIVDRRTWLAQPPFEVEKLNTPVPYVIISHTATESSDTQAGMIYMVRNIQTYHIESRNWADIAYNFLIGGDGSVYEGRGWRTCGSHTYGYNTRAIGISFVGTYITGLPPQISLDACNMLIKSGVQEDHIAANYKLLAHCQCSATESPGRRLFEELQNWEHWTATP